MTEICINEIRTPFEGNYVARFSEELLNKGEIAYLEHMFEKSDRKVSYYLQELAHPDMAETATEESRNEEYGQKADTLPEIVLRELPENYYDV